MPDKLPPTVIVLFGVSGDLAGRKVLPALYHLVKDGLLPKNFKVIGTSRQEITKADLLKKTELCILENDKVCDPKVLKEFNNIFEVMKLDPVKIADYQKLKKYMEDLEEKAGVCFNRIFYLSIPPQVYAPIIRLLGQSGLSGDCMHKVGKSRLLVEKPFGYDLKSAKSLIKETSKHFKENQIFRIDHYLAKETAQNILTFRRYNPLFNEVWNNKLIKRIQVRALEEITIEGRANFYDNVGALRDIIQSHLLQLMAITTMDIPEDISSSDEIHKQKIKLLSKASLAKYKNITRGQYETYRDEIDNQDSSTETYVKLQIEIKNKRWNKVPIILETGKALKEKRNEVILDFCEPNSQLTNQLTIRIQPNEGIGIKLNVKKPGFDNSMQPALMDFNFQEAFKGSGHPDAYERVIVDAIKGDQSLFASSEEVIRSWQILQPIISKWADHSTDLIIYSNGSEGPVDRNLVN
jgi:glucose-6-phosphate 1-dehydrogenase